VRAQRHHVPFYVACPVSAIDPQAPDGASISIEERAVRGHWVSRRAVGYTGRVGAQPAARRVRRAAHAARVRPPPARRSVVEQTWFLTVTGAASARQREGERYEFSWR